MTVRARGSPCSFIHFIISLILFIRTRVAKNGRGFCSETCDSLKKLIGEAGGYDTLKLYGARGE
jgi:hypothetical protein